MSGGRVVRVLDVEFRRRDEVHVVAEDRAQGDGVGVVMILATARLMRQGGIESHALIHPRVAAPDAVAGVRLARRAVDVGEGVARVEHDDAIHENTDGSKPGELNGRSHSRSARNAEERGGTLGHVHEQGGVRGIPIPGSHRVRPQSGGADVGVSCRRGGFVNSAVGRHCLADHAAAPGGHGVGGVFVSIGEIDAGVFAGIGGEPRIKARICGEGVGGEKYSREGQQGSEVCAFHGRVGLSCCDATLREATLTEREAGLFLKSIRI